MVFESLVMNLFCSWLYRNDFVRSFDVKCLQRSLWRRISAIRFYVQLNISNVHFLQSCSFCWWSMLKSPRMRDGIKFSSPLTLRRIPLNVNLFWRTWNYMSLSFHSMSSVSGRNNRVVFYLRLLHFIFFKSCLLFSLKIKMRCVC